MKYIPALCLFFMAIMPLKVIAKQKSITNKIEIKVSKETEIYNKIIKWNKKIDRLLALEIASSLVYNAKLYNVNVNTALAILRQESNFRNIHTYKTIEYTKKYCEGYKCYKVTTEETKPFDLGMSQININTAISAGLDVQRLYDKDLDYELQSFFQILRAKIALCQELGITPSYSCYHSINYLQRNIYVSFVNQYINP